MLKTKKNVLLLVLDSLTADEFEDEKYGEPAMPFLHQLMDNSVAAEQFFLKDRIRKPDCMVLYAEQIH